MNQDGHEDGGNVVCRRNLFNLQHVKGHHEDDDATNPSHIADKTSLEIGSDLGR